MSKCAVGANTSDSIAGAITGSDQNSMDPFFKTIDDLTMANHKKVSCESIFSYKCKYDPSPERKDNSD